MKKNDDMTCTTIMLVGLLTPLVVYYSYFANGFVLSKLWQWFVVYKFNLPSLNVPEAIGIAIIFSFLTSKTWKADEKEKTTAKAVVEFIVGIALPWLTLLIGWVVYYFWIMPK